MIQLVLSIYFTAELRTEFFGVDVRQSDNFYLVAAHFIMAVAGSVMNGYLFWVLQRRHYDTSSLWAYFICVCLLSFTGILAVGQSFGNAVKLANGVWRGNPSYRASATAIVLTIILIAETIYQVRQTEAS
jgi:O-antigen ligase